MSAHRPDGAAAQPPDGSEPWPSAGFAELGRDARGWLVPTPDWWRRQLARPELALVAESCAAERALAQALQHDPLRRVSPAELDRMADADARDNWRVFLRFRERVQQAGSIEAAYAGLFAAGGRVDIAPVFVDALAQAILRGLLDDSPDALEWRAAEMLFRPQRCTRHEGRLLAGDRATLDMLNETGGYGTLGRLLAQAGAAPRALPMEVLTADHGAAYFAEAEQHRFLLDMTSDVANDIGHGVTLRLAAAHGGPKWLARVLERWIAHLLGTPVRIQPRSRIDDADWRWHVGLDAVATALLNDLYAGREVDEERLQRVVALFRLEFVSPADVQPELAGRPVYLAACMDGEGLLRLKPQNLLDNLPLARRG